MNEGIYSYKSNLNQLEPILAIAAKNENVLKNFNSSFLKIVSNTLRLLFVSSNISKKIEKEIIILAKDILHNKHVKEVYTSNDYFEAMGANDLIGYLILFYFTRDEEDNIKFDYKEHKIKAPAEHQDFISLLVNLFADDYRGISDASFAFLEIALSKECIKDIKEYLQYYQVIYFDFEKEKFDDLLKK